MYHNPVEVPQKEHAADRYICGILLTVIFILILMLAEGNKNTGKVRNFNSENTGIGKDIEHKSYLDDALLIERQSAVNVTINGLEKSDWRYDNVADCSTKFDKVRQSSTKGGGGV